MKADLIPGSKWAVSKLLLLRLGVLLSLFQPSLAVAQGNCAMEQDVFNSWTSTVEADKKDIGKVEQAQGSDSSQLTKLRGKFQKDTQRLRDAQTRFLACRNRTNSSTQSPLAGTLGVNVSATNPGDREFEIQGLGMLSLGKPDPGRQEVGAKLVLETDQFEGIPRGTILELAGTLADANLDIQGSKVTKGDYLHLDHEVPSYEYTLRITGQLDQQGPQQLQGTATLTKSTRYRSDRGQVVRSFGIVGRPPNPVKAESHCGGGTCPACRTCTGNQCVADDSLPFDDGKFCTSCDGLNPGPDCCRNGVGLGKPIEDRESAVAATEEWDFSQLARILGDASKAFEYAPGCSMPPVSITGAIEMKPVQQCCERTRNLRSGYKLSGSLGIEGLGVECASPLFSVRIPGIAEVGLVLGVSLFGEASGSGIEGSCSDCGWSVDLQGGVKAQGKLVALTEIDPGLLHLEGGLEGDGTLQGTCNCNGCGNVRGCLGPLSVFGTVVVGGWVNYSIDVVIPNTERCTSIVIGREVI